MNVQPLSIVLMAKPYLTLSRVSVSARIARYAQANLKFFRLHILLPFFTLQRKLRMTSQWEWIKFERAYDRQTSLKDVSDILLHSANRGQLLLVPLPFTVP